MSNFERGLDPKISIGIGVYHNSMQPVEIRIGVERTFDYEVDTNENEFVSSISARSEEEARAKLAAIMEDIGYEINQGDFNFLGERDND